MMQLSQPVRLTMVIGGIALAAVAIAGSAWGHLDASIVGDVLQLAGAALVGLGAASGPSPRRDRQPLGVVADEIETPPATPLPRPPRGGGRSGVSGLPLGLLLLMALAPGAPSGCSAWQEPPPEGACAVERRVVDGLAAARVALEAVAPEIPSDVLADLDATLESGRALVATCDAARDRAAWEAWIGPALQLAQSIAGIISRRSGAKLKGAVARPAAGPPELERAIRLLEAEAARE